MADVFISFKQEDRTRAENIALALGDLGFDVWWDFDHLRGAQPTAVMRELIDHCQAVVLIWSEHSIANRFIQDEARHAHSQGKLLPVRFSESVEPPVPFTRMETEELHDWSGQIAHEGFSRIVAQVETLCGRKGSPDAALPPEAERTRRELEAFKAALLTGTREALEQFVLAWPTGQFSEFARSMTPNLRAQNPPLPPLSGPAPRPHARPAPSQPRRGGGLWVAVAAGALAAALIGGLAYWRPWQPNAPVAASEEVAAFDPAIAGQGGPPSEGGERMPLESAEDLARTRIAEQGETDAWTEARRLNTPESYRAYLSAHPQGRFAAQARAAEERLTERAAPSVNAEIRALNQGPRPSAPPDNPFASELLHPEVAAVVAQARAAASAAEASAANGRAAANEAEIAAARARRGEPGAAAVTDNCQGSRCVYETQTQGQVRSGFGVRQILDGPLQGEIYRGEWRDNRFNGVGVLTFGDGAANPHGFFRFEGQFVADRMAGTGALYYADGGRYTGQFQGGQPHGVGKRDGLQQGVYEGQFAQGERTGLGVLWSPQGAVLQQGEFRDGRLVRPLSR